MCFGDGTISFLSFEMTPSCARERLSILNTTVFMEHVCARAPKYFENSSCH